MRKIIILTLTLVLLISTVCFAAVSSSGSRSSSSGSKSSFSAPSGSSSVKSTSPSNTNGTYKPSAPANSFGDKAPAQQTPGVQPNQTQSSTGGFWRNASMFGGGFLAGSLLGNMFGFGIHMGMGGMSSLFGLLINILLIGGIVLLGRNLWDKYQNKDKDKDRYR